MKMKPFPRPVPDTGTAFVLIHVLQGLINRVRAALHGQCAALGNLQNREVRERVDEGVIFDGRAEHGDCQRIPADIDINDLKVTEIISGNYTPSGGKVTLGEDGKYRVTFENTYGDTEYKTGVINNYTRTEGEKAADKTTYPTGERGDNKSTQPNGSN